MNNSLEEKIVTTDKNKDISNFFVHKMIKYSDRKVIEKVQKIEEANKVKFSRKVVKRIFCMNLYI